MTRAVLPGANDTGVPLIVTAGAPAVRVCPLTTTGGFVIDKAFEDIGNEEKRDGPRKVGGDRVMPFPVVGVKLLVAALPPEAGAVPPPKPLPSCVTTTVI